jgi:hypothetical protein
MSAIGLPAPRPTSSRSGRPRAALIAAADEDEGAAGDGAGDGDGDAGEGAGPGDGVGAPPASGDGDPLPPQEATPAIRRASASRRAVEAAFRAVGILSSFFDESVMRDDRLAAMRTDATTRKSAP